MSTPVTPATPAGPNPTMVAALKPATISASTTTNSAIYNDLKWLWTHLLLLALVAGLILGGVYEVESIIAKHDAANNSKWQSILNTQTAQTQAIQDQLSTDEKNWQQVQADLLAQNTSLAKTITQRDTQTAQQVQNDKNLTSQEAAERLATQTSAQADEVVAQGNNLVVDLPTSTRIIGDLDLLGSVQADLADTKTQLANETTVANNAQANVVEQSKVVATQQVELADATKACDARVAEANAKGRKAGIKGFIIGVATVLIGIAGHSL